VSECDREASIVRRPWPTKSCGAIGKKIKTCVSVRDKGLTCRPIDN
jgi:hypothetical protein